MPEIHRSALVPYTPDQMYGLVRDVESYPSFLGWVRSAEVHEEDQQHQLATLEVALGGLVRRFTTRNTLVPGERLIMQLERGPFEELGGEWSFRPVGEGCRVGLDLRFSAAGSILLRPFQRNFSRMADRMVDDFTRRAERVHGR
ncbi:type II toxin-antitoxin system RatA family toxin [Wenzhouxiangella sp. XN201]|uniref:type II toxin-antitoxin system RatA family toxin n=1 Tax=Wenzhouxiangella sp. XN201 TaxID=2710755 RepID=UPI0013CABBC7|nr:type II toxin-antitoxin system RatA family toxin [Wenzhouxiangella sp. XN201]NEZ04153.1 type II toxin-antitoxin system RatA family toxin [Wenzhouxiangella sp. XN201]